MQIKYHWKRISGDIIFFSFAVFPATYFFFSDLNGQTEDMFLRCGALMALFAAFLEFRTHHVQIQKHEDKFNGLWKSIAEIAEDLVEADKKSNVALRNQSSVIVAAGMEPEMGRPEEIRDKAVAEELLALKNLRQTPDSYYTYNTYVSNIGKVLVILGTVIWAFGDCAVELLKT